MRRSRSKKGAKINSNRTEVERKTLAGTNWPSDTIGDGRRSRRKAKRNAFSRERALHTSSSSFSSSSRSSSLEPHVTNGRQLKVGRPRAFKRRHFRSHVRNESSGTRTDASAAQKDAGNATAPGRVAPLREASSETRFKAV